MALPDVIVRAADGGLGLLPAATDQNRVLLGICSEGDGNTIYPFTSKKLLHDTLGYGPLVDAAAHSLDVAGGTVYCVPVTTAEKGAAGSVTKVGTGPAISIASGSGVTDADTAMDDYEVVIEIVAGGAIGTSTLKVSLDGGRNYGPARSTAATMKIGHDEDVQITLAAGTYVAGDTYSFSVTAPIPTSVEISAALDVVIADSREWGFVHVVGAQASGANCKTVATALGSKLTAAETAHRYAFGIVEAPDVSDSSLISTFATFADSGVMVAAGFEYLVSPITGLGQKRSAGFAIGARLAKAPIHEDAGRFASGPLSGILELDRDERETPGLDEARFATLRTHIGEAGFYVTGGKLMAAEGSDYRHVQHKRVINTARKTTRRGLMRYLSDTVRVNATTGYILETEARAIEASIQSQLEAALVSPGHASSVSVQVPRDENILSSEKLSVTIRIVPLGYLRAIEAEVGLDNPSLRAA